MKWENLVPNLNYFRWVLNDCSNASDGMGVLLAAGLRLQSYSVLKILGSSRVI